VPHIPSLDNENDVLGNIGGVAADTLEVAGGEIKARLDGRAVLYVEEQAAISRRYRDRGHPKFWGRIIGTSADAESAEWLANKFRAAGLSDVRPLDLSPQWFPQKWDVTVVGGGKTIALESAQPDYRAAALPPGGIDVNAVYAGLGSAADLTGKAKLFEKTALSINCEHPSTIQTYVRPRYIAGDTLHWSNMYTAQQWYAGGASRPELTRTAVTAFREFGVPLLSEPNPRPPAGDLGRLYRFTPGVATSEFFHYFHTDRETPETVPWTGLQATTRAYAKIIDEVNKQPLSMFQRPEEMGPSRQPMRAIILVFAGCSR
jgi:hypothetical protein